MRYISLQNSLSNQTEGETRPSYSETQSFQTHDTAVSLKYHTKNCFTYSLKVI